MLSNGKKYRAHQLQKVGAEDKGESDVVRKEKRKHKQEQLLRREGIDERNIIKPILEQNPKEKLEGDQIQNLLSSYFFKPSEPKTQISIPTKENQISSLLNNFFFN